MKKVIALILMALMTLPGCQSARLATGQPTAEKTTAATADLEEMQVPQLTGETKDEMDYKRHSIGDASDVSKPSDVVPEAEVSTTAPTQTVKEYGYGTLKVGVDIPAGEYRLEGSGGGCYFSVESGSGSDAELLDNGFFYTISYLTVSEGQYLKMEDMHAIAVADVEPYEGTIENGTFKVGFDIPAGEYRVKAGANGTGYLAIYNSSAVDSYLENNDFFEGSSYVTVREGQYLELDDCSLEIE